MHQVPRGTWSCDTFPQSASIKGHFDIASLAVTCYISFILLILISLLLVHSVTALRLNPHRATLKVLARLTQRLAAIFFIKIKNTAS